MSKKNMKKRSTQSQSQSQRQRKSHSLDFDRPEALVPYLRGLRDYLVQSQSVLPIPAKEIWEMNLPLMRFADQLGNVSMQFSFWNSDGVMMLHPVGERTEGCAIIPYQDDRLMVSIFLHPAVYTQTASVYDPEQVYTKPSFLADPDLLAPYMRSAFSMAEKAAAQHVPVAVMPFSNEHPLVLSGYILETEETMEAAIQQATGYLREDVKTVAFIQKIFQDLWSLRR